MITEYALTKIKEAGVDASELVGWVASEWSDGYCQYLCCPSDENGPYVLAREYINADPEHMLMEYGSNCQHPINQYGE